MRVFLQLQNTMRLPVQTIIALSLLWAADAHAYLDPSTGTMIISAIVGIFASLALALKTYWYKLKKLFSGGRGKKSDSGER